MQDGRTESSLAVDDGGSLREPPAASGWLLSSVASFLSSKGRDTRALAGGGFSVGNGLESHEIQGPAVDYTVQQSRLSKQPAQTMGIESQAATIQTVENFHTPTIEDLQRLLDHREIRVKDLEKHNKLFQVVVKDKDKELSTSRARVEELERQVKAHQDVASIEVKDNEIKRLQHSLSEFRIECQKLKNWKSDQEKQRDRDLKTTAQWNTKIADLTTANDRLETKSQLLANQVKDQQKRIQELKQQTSSLELKMGTKDTEAQSLRDRLREEREKSSKLSEELLECHVQIADLKESVQTSALKSSKVSEELQQCHLQIADLKQSLQTLETSTLKVSSEANEAKSLRDQLHEERQKFSDLNEGLQQRDLEIDKLKQCVQRFTKGWSAVEMQLVPKDSEVKSQPKPLRKESELSLRIDELERQNLILKNRVANRELIQSPEGYNGGGSFLETQSTPYLLDGALQRVHDVARIFAKLLMKAMEHGKVDGMAVARNSFVRSVSLGKAAPLKYVLEAITCKLLFHGFENESYDLEDSTSAFLDMEQYRMDNFRQYLTLRSMDNPEKLVLTSISPFNLFCRNKLRDLGQAIPEVSNMVTEIISQTFETPVSPGDISIDTAAHLPAKLGKTFVKLALCVWQVHKLAFSFRPMARIFRVSQSDKYVEKFMEPVIFQESDSEEDDNAPKADTQVGFMVVPGFLINKIVVRSRVFVLAKPVAKKSQPPLRS